MIVINVIEYKSIDVLIRYIKAMNFSKSNLFLYL